MEKLIYPVFLQKNAAGYLVIIPKVTGILYRLPDKAFIYKVEAEVNRYRNKYKDLDMEDKEDE